MKPQRLVMQAFGSYGRKTEIDFTRLNQNLFLISGDTGSGKTTIFDAIVFALYGEASSDTNRKDGIELQSDFAEKGIAPFVELMFTEGEEEFTVHRVPRHIRAKSRGSGVTTENESVFLLLPDGTAFSGNIKETDAKIEQIVGLSKNQFMQVGMIAQGEFMELLRARTEDKKQIFRKLFNTELYQKLVDELFERKKKKAAEMEQIRIAMRTECARLVIPLDYPHAEDIAQIQKRILSSDVFSVTDMEAFTEHLQKICDLLRQQSSSVQKESDAAACQRDQIRDALAGARSLSALFEQYEKANKELEECASDAQSAASWQEMKRRIENAYEIQAAYLRWEDADTAQKKTEKDLAKEKEMLPMLKASAEKAAELEENAEHTLKKAREQYAITAEKAESAMQLFNRIQKAKEAEGDALQQYEKAKKDAAAAAEKLMNLEIQEKTWRNRSLELNRAEMLLAQWQAESDSVSDLIAEAENVIEQERDLQQKKLDADEKRKEHRISSELYLKKNEELITAQSAFLDAQAGMIAREQLRPGKPCPVCGSKEHPHPCQLKEEHSELTREKIRALERETASLRKAQEGASEKAMAASERCRTLEEQLASGISRLSQRVVKLFSEQERTLSPEEAMALLNKRLNELVARGPLLEENARELSTLRKALSNIDEIKEDARKASELANRNASEAQNRSSACQAARESLEQNAVYDSPEIVQEELLLVRNQSDGAEAQWKGSREAAKEAEAKLENTAALIRRFETELPALAQTAAQRREEYRQTAEGFSLNETDWKAIVSKYDRSESQTLQVKIDEYRQKKAAAEKMASSVLEAIAGRTKPDVPPLEAELSKTEETLKEINGKLQMIREQFGTDRQLLEAISPKMEERSALLEEQRRVDALYRLLAGQVSGARMDIETFVQRYYLERILFSANERFRQMSAGQFELRLCDLERAGEGKNRGLDLMVYSAVTGKEREVRTLSGGESFMAALSLALGMADQIQQHSSSIRLDVMFIDEGFGSLDEHSRAQAVSVLRQMAEGSKMIGIISHVSELKQEIDDLLLVTKDDQGSRVRWQIS